MRKGLLFSVGLVVACGRSDPFEDAKPVPPRAEAPAPVNACRTTCTTTPKGLETPIESAPTGVPLHWLSCEGCLRVTIDRDLPTQSRSRVSLVVKNWTAALQGQRSQPGLCFVIDERPTTRDPDEPRRIHLRALDPGRAMSTTQLTTTTFHARTGEFISSEVEVAGLDPVRELTYGMGRALGLGSSSDRQRSAMVVTGGLETPGPADAASLQAMYGPPAWCNP